MSTLIQIETEGNVVHVAGAVGLMTYRRLLAAIHNITYRKGYEEVVLDFSPCAVAYAGPMLAICATLSRLRREGIDFRLIPPQSTKAAGLFRNTNWAHLIDPGHFSPSTFRGYTHVPAINFSSPAEQFEAVNRMIDATLFSMESLERDDLQAIEWALNEVTDNVLVHARSDSGGFVQLTNHSRKRQVEFVVSDAGAGIPTTLREGHPEVRYDTDALELAIREGVTRDLSVGQGNGLFGTFQATRIGGGYFHVHSGYARLDHEQDQLRIRMEQIPISGSLVVACMDCSNPAALGEALRLEGQKAGGWGYINYKYEPDEQNNIVIILKDEASSFGSRPAGEPVRIKLTNLLGMHPNARVTVDFSGIPIISSSFADEIFGKLFVKLGPLAFMRSIDMRNVSDTVRALIDKAIMQRSRTGL